MKNDLVVYTSIYCVKYSDYFPVMLFQNEELGYNSNSFFSTLNNQLYLILSLNVSVAQQKHFIGGINSLSQFLDLVCLVAKVCFVSFVKIQQSFGLIAYPLLVVPFQLVKQVDQTGESEPVNRKLRKRREKEGLHPLL